MLQTNKKIKFNLIYKSSVKPTAAISKIAKRFY